MSLDTLKQIRLLYVEDDENIRRILSRGLERRVKELSVAVDGKDGLEKFSSFKPDIIVTDIKMPNLSGLEMSKRIREIDPKIPIVITSAHGESETLLDAIEIGVNGYILKPIDKDKLFDTITFYAKNKVLEKELEIKSKQLAIQSKNAALGELIENIAHQWRQPLSVISTTAGSVQIKSELNSLDKEFTVQSMETIARVTQKLSATIEYFRDSYTNDSESKEEFFVGEIIANVIENLKIKLEDNNINIVNVLSEKIELENYPNLLFQSVNNILLNSIEALIESSVEDKYIFVDFMKMDDSIVINIKDNAGGIDEEVMSHIFEPYYTTHHKSQGKGLGLYMTVQMVETGLNGSLDFSNQEFSYKDTDYKGAMFTIKLK